MNRREFLLGLGSLTGSTFLSGCVPEINAIGSLLPDIGASLANTFGGNNKSVFATGTRLGTVLDDQQSLVAQQIFESSLSQTKTVAPSTADVERVILSIERACQDLSRRKVDWYSIPQIEEVARIAVPLIGEADRAFAIQERYDGGDGSVIALGPGERLDFNFHGYCMDQSLQPPARSPLRLFPLERYYPADQARQIAAIGQFIANESPDQRDSQGLLWALQSSLAGGREPNLNNEQWAMLRAASPETAQMLHQQKMMNQVASFAQRALGDIVQIGTRDIPLNTADRQSVQRLMDALLEGNGNDYRREVSRDSGFVEGGSPFTLLADDVAAEAHATSRLAGNVRVINASGQSFLFNPFNYLAEAVSNTQRVLFSGLSLPRGSGLQRLTDAYSGFTNWFGNWAEGSMGNLGKSLSWDRSIRENPLYRSVATAMTDSMVSTPMKLLLDHTPIIGNFLSLVETATGYSWNAFLDSPANREDYRLSPTAHVFSAMGIIPGAGTVARALRSSGDVATGIRRVVAARNVGTAAYDAYGASEWANTHLLQPALGQVRNVPAVSRMVETLAPVVNPVVRSLT